MRGFLKMGNRADVHANLMPDDGAMRSMLGSHPHDLGERGKWNFLSWIGERRDAALAVIDAIFAEHERGSAGPDRGRLRWGERHDPAIVPPGRMIDIGQLIQAGFAVRLKYADTTTVRSPFAAGEEPERSPEAELRDEDWDRQSYLTRLELADRIRAAADGDSDDEDEDEYLLSGLETAANQELEVVMIDAADALAAVMIEMTHQKALQPANRATDVPDSVTPPNRGEPYDAPEMCVKATDGTARYQAFDLGATAPSTESRVGAATPPGRPQKRG